MSDQYRYTQFPEGLWEIIWLGDIKFIRNQTKCFQPVIDVTLLQWGAFPQTTCSVPIGIGQIFNLIPGSLWRDGYLVQDKMLASLQEKSIFTIFTHQAKFIRAGSSINEEEGEDAIFWLPFGQFKKHAQHTESWCVLVETQHTDIIIPCSEILRFYFAFSSNLIKRIVHTYFNPRNIWREHQFNSETGFLELTLATEISGASAADIGRIALDSSAFNAAMMVSKHLTAAIANSQKAYIKMLLPFTGRSSLKVLGRHLILEGVRPRFVVNQIASCSHPLPFKSLRYIAHTRVKKNYGDSSDVGKAQGDALPSTIFNAKSKVDQLTNEEPNQNRQTKSVKWKTAIRFPDLLYKQVLRVSPEHTVARAMTPKWVLQAMAMGMLAKLPRLTYVSPTIHLMVLMS